MAQITIKEAAEALGVSVDTVRRRIKENKIDAWKIQGQYGPQWVIHSDSLARYQKVVEAVPVKYNLDPNVLMDNIKETVLEATREAARQGTLQAMQEHDEELESLRGEVKALRESIDLIVNQKEKQSFIEKLTSLLKKDK
jgi:excisionase family DNA binding protein